MTPPVISGMTSVEGFEPFDLLTGANFEIVVYTEVKGGRKDRKYDKSKFQARQPLGTEEKMELIYNEINSDSKWSLKQYVDPAKFKTYEVLKKELDRALGFDWQTGNSVQDASRSKPVSRQSQKTPDDDNPPWNSDADQTALSNESSSFANDDEFLKSLTEND